MKTLKVDVQTRDILYRPEIFGYGKPIVIGERVEVADGVTFRNDGGIERRGADSVAPIFHFTLEFAEPIAQAAIAGVVSAWLVAKFGPHVRPERGDKVTIERTEVQLEEGQVTRVITEKITAEKADPKR